MWPNARDVPFIGPCDVAKCPRCAVYRSVRCGQMPEMCHLSVGAVWPNAQDVPLIGPCDVAKCPRCGIDRSVRCGQMPEMCHLSVRAMWPNAQDVPFIGRCGVAEPHKPAENCADWAFGHRAIYRVRHYAYNPTHVFHA